MSHGVRASLASLVEDFLRRGDEVAVVAHRGNRRYRTSYGELVELAGRFAAELEARGAGPGDRVVLWGENSAEWIGCFFGCVLRGVIVVPLDAAGSAVFAERVVRDVGPRLVVGDAELLRRLGAEDVVGVAYVSLPDLRTHSVREPVFAVSAAVNEQTPFQIVFTSGTTSEPKGIVHTHRNVLVTLEPIEREMQGYLRYERWVHPLRFLHSLPLSHVFGQFMGLWIPALLGAEVHFADALEPRRMVEVIRRERISVLIAVPRILQLMMSHIVVRFPGLNEEIAASAGERVWRRWWRFRRVHRVLGWKFWAVISGGATLPAEVESFWNGLGFALIQGYGMTETSALVTLNHPFKIKQGTIGAPLPGREVKITEEGEILVRGEMLAGAMWQGGGMRKREGEWLATGDLAERSESGELRFIGRKGDVIVTAAGMNVHPADLEQALLGEAGVRACAVVACEMGAGAEPVAVVIFSGGEEMLQAAVSAANAGLAEFQKIRRVLRWPELVFPYTSTGKLMRREVAEWAGAQVGRGSGTGSGVTGVDDMVLGLVGEASGDALASHGDRAKDDALRLSEDLHLDSLGRVQLQTLIERRFGIELSYEELAGASSVGELRALVEHGSEPVAAYSGTESDKRAFDRAVNGRADTVAQEDDDSYPHWPWSWPVHALRVVFVEAVMRPLVWFLAAAKIERRDVTYPDGPLLLIANHVTAYDGALVLYALPWALRRRVAIAMSGEMLRDLRRGRNQGNWLLNVLAPFGYWLATALFNVYPLPRARGFRRSFAHAGEAMDRGYSVLVFPEGTRTRDGELHAFRPGVGLLAEQSGVPILPVALVGLGALRVAGRGWFRSGRLIVRIGRPVAPPDGLGDAGPFATKLHETLETLLMEPG